MSHHIPKTTFSIPINTFGKQVSSVTNALYYGDNLAVLREHVPDESIDLIYLDPPFNSNANYNVLFSSPKGFRSGAQIHAFEDTWHWGEQAEKEFDDLLHQSNTPVSEMMQSLRAFLGENDIMAYLTMMANRLLELHRALKPNGSLYLHCDPTASHYLKIVLDSVFGPRNFRSEIVWKRSSAHSDAKQGRKLHGHIHDAIFFYTKSSDWTWNEIYTPYDAEYVERDYRLVDEKTGRRFRRGDLTAAKPGGDVEYDWRVKKHANVRERWIADLDEEYLHPVTGWEYKGVPPYDGRYWAYSKENMRQFALTERLRHTYEGMPEYKRYFDEMPGVPLQDLWMDITPIVAGAPERLGYPTQKPVPLLERIIYSSSAEGAVVLDPFCGCGTAIHAAQKLGRSWIGIDVTHLAISLIEKRLTDSFPTVKFKVYGTPQDLDGARDLAERDKYQFQWWACSLVNAQPYGGKKKGADSGIDGVIYFQDDKGAAKKLVVSVKGGRNISVQMIRDLRGVIEREKASIGIFLTLEEPTRPMKSEALKAGYYSSPVGHKYPKLQVLTVEALLSNSDRPIYPDMSGGAKTFKKVPREMGRDTQRDLFADPSSINERRINVIDPLSVTAGAGRKPPRRVTTAAIPRRKKIPLSTKG